MAYVSESYRKSTVVFGNDSVYSVYRLRQLVLWLVGVYRQGRGGEKNGREKRAWKTLILKRREEWITLEEREKISEIGLGEERIREGREGIG